MADENRRWIYLADGQIAPDKLDAWLDTPFSNVNLDVLEKFSHLPQPSDPSLTPREVFDLLEEEPVAKVERGPRLCLRVSLFLDGPNEGTFDALPALFVSFANHGGTGKLEVVEAAPEGMRGYRMRMGRRLESKELTDAEVEEVHASEAAEELFELAADE